MALQVGARLGHYDVTALIGEGGMGQVYRATDTKRSRRVALVLGVFFVLAASVAHAQSATPRWTERGPATLLRTETFDIDSRSTGRTYRVWVHTPEGYGELQDHPVVYLLDAVWDIDTAVGTVRRLQFADLVPDVVVVGVGYHDHVAQVRHRAQDLTPTAEPWLVEKTRRLPPQWAFDGTGEADKFYAFLRDELIPGIEDRFAVSSTDRALVGHSLGGLFALHALFRDDRLFQRFVALSPALWWGDGVLFEQEAAFARTTNQLAGRLFVSIGGLEPESDEFREPEISAPGKWRV